MVEQGEPGDGRADNRTETDRAQGATGPEAVDAVGVPLATVAAGVSLTHVLDETVLLNAESGVYYGLNDTGRLMLDLALSRSDPDDVVGALEAQLPADRAELEDDLYGLLSQLAEEGLVEVSPNIAAEVARAAKRLQPQE